MPEHVPTLTDPNSLEAGYSMLRDTCGLVELNGISAIALVGLDRKGWLQGQATNDMRSLSIGRRLSFCLCKPTGQIEAVATAWETADSLHLTCNSECVEVFQDRIRKFVILEEVRLEPFDGKVISVQGPTASRDLARMMELPALDAGIVNFKGKEILCLRSDRTGTGGWDLYLPKGTRAPEKALRDAFHVVSPEALTIAQLEAGIPQWGIDIDSKTMPPELGDAFKAQYVSYSKGCYSGQEVLMRIHSRGHTNRTWMGIYVDRVVSAGQKIYCRGNEAGVITSSLDSPELGAIAAGFVKNQYAFGGEEVEIVTASGRVCGELRTMPLMRLG